MNWYIYIYRCLEMTRNSILLMGLHGLAETASVQLASFQPVYVNQLRKHLRARKSARNPTEVAQMRDLTPPRRINMPYIQLP